MFIRPKMDPWLNQAKARRNKNACTGKMKSSEKEALFVDDYVRNGFILSFQDYLKEAFSVGFIMNGIAEPAFPQHSDLSEHKGWHNLPEIPVVFIAKLKK